MYSKSHLTSLIAAASIASDHDALMNHDALMRLKSLPYHDRSKGKGKSKPGKVYKIKPLRTYNKTQECARRISRGW